jgi:hypothetical protein
VVIDVAGSLRAGENRIQVNGEMFGGSAGFICQINADGADVPIVATDETWEMRKPKAKEWQAAVVEHNYGAGPWKKALHNQPASSAVAAQAAGGRPVRAALVKNDFLMRSLGRPHRDQVVTSRPSELTTLQAIDLSNGEILAKYLQAGAGKLKAKHKNPGELIDWLYQTALSRAPTADERAVLSGIVGDDLQPAAVEDLLWAVVMLPEFQIVR